MDIKKTESGRKQAKKKMNTKGKQKLIKVRREKKKFFYSLVKVKAVNLVLVSGRLLCLPMSLITKATLGRNKAELSSLKC